MQKLNSYFADFKQMKKVGYFVNNTVSQATFGCLLLTVQPLYVWWDAMPRHWPPIAFTVSAMDLREHFFLSGVFYLTLIPAGFKASPAMEVQP